MRLDINFDTYLELEKISNGTFKPLNGFIDEEDFYSISEEMRLRNGHLFPIPIMLPVSKKFSKRLKKNSEIFFFYNDKKVGSLLVNSVFEINLAKHKENLFGTSDVKHPGYKLLKDMGEFYVGGKIKTFFSIEYKYSKYAISPDYCKKIIKELGLKTIAGFQTRNVPHRAHEYILLDALNKVDGLLVHPLIGRKKKGDFLPEAILGSYEYLINKVYLNKNIILAALTTYMRYAGPREALFHALIRKNYGCTHFLVGRDHAGVGNFYGLYEAQEMCLKFESELNIKIIKVRGPFFCKKCKKITTDKICKDLSAKIDISGTKIRKALLKNQDIKDIFMRKEIVKLLRKEKIFIN